MKKAITITLVFLLCLTVKAQEQKEPPKLRYFNIGVGASSWGVPVYGSIEFPVGKKDKPQDQTIALGASYQSKSETYTWFGDEVTWRHTIIGINASFHYYFDRLIDLDEDFDIYGGLGLGYYSWKTTLKETSNSFSGNYSGTGSGGIGISYIAGARYYLNKNISLNIHYGGNTILSSARIGISFRF